MATTPAPTHRADIKTLLNAIASDPSEVRLGQALTTAQWDMLAAYMQPMEIAAGRVLIAQGAEDRTLYFVESGMLTVHFEDSAGKIRLAAVGAGAVIGEGGFFSRMARSATVQAGSACRLWTLSPMRFSELANRQPTVALALAMALGAIMARRMVSNRRKIAIT
jgi:CRP/FNR family cyclic AMP-dependent transcriptional regulator